MESKNRASIIDVGIIVEFRLGAGKYKFKVEHFRKFSISFRGQFGVYIRLQRFPAGGLELTIDIPFFRIIFGFGEHAKGYKLFGYSKE